MNSRYQAYLESSHWKHLRQDALRLTDHLCSACNSALRVDVHHLAYKDLYDCTTDDVMPLCRRCHYAIHKSDKLNSLLKGMLVQEKRAYIIQHLQRFFADTFYEVARYQEKGDAWSESKNPNKQEERSKRKLVGKILGKMKKLTLAERRKKEREFRSLPFVEIRALWESVRCKPSERVGPG